MKGIIILLFIVYAAVGRAQNTLLVEECPKDQAIDWTIELLIRHEDCNKFYMCTFGQPVEYTCPANLWFNLETQRCDWRENVDCSDRNVPGETTTTTPEPTTTTPTSTTTPAPTTTTTTTPVPTTTSTTTTPAPTTTTSTTTTTTPAPTTTTSTTPEPTTTTSTTTTTTPAPTTTSTTTTTPAPTTTTSTTTSTTPEPTTTTSTTTTTTPAPTTTTAAPTTTTSTTPVPTTTSTTSTTPAPTTSTSTTSAPTSFLPNGCPTDPFIHWLLPHESDCNAFYYCVWGQLVLRECPSTLHFNRVLQVCDWPWDAGCPTGRSLNKHLSSRQLMR